MATTRTRDPVATRQSLIQAAQLLILRQGFSATTLEQICDQAECTKGSLFHHFANKDALIHAAVDAWAAMGHALYSQAWLQQPDADPVEQIHALFAIMESFTWRPEPCVCVVGMVSQEAALADNVLREKCATYLQDWTDMVVTLVNKAIKKHQPQQRIDAEQVGWLLNSIWQGSMLVAKTKNNPALIRQNLAFARQFIDQLLLPVDNSQDHNHSSH